MTTGTPQPYLQIELALVAALASFAASWLAARFALSRFSREKVWERKAAAYTSIFEAVHLIGRWYEKHYEAVIEHRDMDEKRRSQLQDDAKQAEDDLERRLAAESWLIPDDCRTRLETMTRDLKNLSNKHPNSFEDYLDEGAFIAKSATKELRPMVQADLKLDRSWFG